jgi:hypothetical protein
MGLGRRLSRALAYRVRNKLSSSGVKAGSVTDIGRPFLVVDFTRILPVAKVVGITPFG